MNIRFPLTALLVLLCFVSLTVADDPFGDPGNKDVKMEKKTDQPPKSYETVDAEAAERAIRVRMNLAVKVDFVEVPMFEAVAELSGRTGIPMKIDSRSLEEIGLSSDEAVTLNVQNISLRSCLNLMLRPYELTYVIDNETLMITTAEAADENLTTKVYSLPFHVACHADAFKLAMQNAIVHDTWDVLGGPSTATVVGPTLVISTTEMVHEEVTKLIATVEEKIGEAKKK